MFKAYSLLLCLLYLSGAAFSQQSISAQKLEKKISEYLEVSRAPGVAVAVVTKDKVLLSKGYGYRNLEKKQVVDANTLFAIGSTSKAFTTALLGVLEQSHKLSFDESPRKYLSDLNFYNDQLNSELTIKDLICHRSGLPRHDYSWYLFPTEDKDSLLARVAYHEPFTDIRTAWYYNNFAYLIQGLIAEELTEQTWEENIAEKFFKPLEMSRSNTDIYALQRDKNRATGYQWKQFKNVEPMDYFNIAAIGAAGSVNSSVSEMGNWMQTWLNGGKYKGVQVLPESYVRKAMNPLMLVGEGVKDPKFPDQHLNAYGYAWFISSYKGHYRMEHGGNIDGFSANVCLFPYDDLGIVVLTNQNASLLPTLIRNEISDMVLKLPESDWMAYLEEKIDQAKKQIEKQKEAQSSSRVAAAGPSHNLSSYAGNYSQPGYGTFAIQLKNDSLFARFREYQFYLQPWHYDVFKPREISKGRVDMETDAELDFNFQSNLQGDISGVAIKIEPTLDPLIFSRSAFNVELSEEQLASFAGVYELGGMKIKVTKAKDGLFLDVPGQPQYTLKAISDSEFVVHGLQGYKARFEVANELHMIQPNGTFVAKKLKP